MIDSAFEGVLSGELIKMEQRITIGSGLTRANSWTLREHYQKLYPNNHISIERGWIGFRVLLNMERADDPGCFLRNIDPQTGNPL
jgi:hypothetical protein